MEDDGVYKAANVSAERRCEGQGRERSCARPACAVLQFAGARRASRLMTQVRVAESGRQAAERICGETAKKKATQSSHGQRTDTGERRGVRVRRSLSKTEALLRARECEGGGRDEREREVEREARSGKMARRLFGQCSGRLFGEGDGVLFGDPAGGARQSCGRQDWALREAADERSAGPSVDAMGPLTHAPRPAFADALRDPWAIFAASGTVNLPSGLLEGQLHIRRLCLAGCQCSSRPRLVLVTDEHCGPAHPYRVTFQFASSIREPDG